MEPVTERRFQWEVDGLGKVGGKRSGRESEKKEEKARTFCALVCVSNVRTHTDTPHKF